MIMLDHDPKSKSTNTPMTARATRHKNDTDASSRATADEDSDAESFHSAISSVTKPTTHCFYARKQPRTATEHRNPRRDGARVSSQKSSPPEAKPSSRSSSARSRQDPAPMPIRKSSSSRKKSRRTDSVTLHRQSCQLFSSMDGILAFSREFTPLPSTSSSRTATRHTSISAERFRRPSYSDTSTQDAVQRVCETIDAKLRLAQTQHHHPIEFASRSTFTSSPSAPSPGDSQTLTPLDISPRMSMSQDTCTRISTRWEYKGSGNTTESNIRHYPGPPAPQLDSVITWTSDATRRRDYAKIDRAHRGVRGFFRQLLPRCLCKNARKGFFTGDCDGDSVRRFRMDVSDETGERSGSENGREPGPGIVQPKKEKGGLYSNRMEAAISHTPAQTKSVMIMDTQEHEQQYSKTTETGWVCFR